MKMSRGPFFFFFRLSLFETTEIYLKSTKTKIFNWEKEHFTLEKLEKVIWPPPKKKYASYASDSG